MFTTRYNLALTCLGDGKKVLGDINDTAEVLDAVDTGLDGAGVILPRSIENALHLVMLALSKFLVHWSGIGVHRPVDGQEGKSNN